MHAVFITETGELWGIGDNSSGQYGIHVDRFTRRLIVRVVVSLSLAFDTVQVSTTNTY